MQRVYEKMIGKLNFTDVSYTDDVIYFKVAKEHKWFIKNIAEALKFGFKNGKDLGALSVDWFKKPRTLSQNGLMWALLTELALFLGEGKKDPDFSPEKLYYSLLSKYGIAEYLETIPEAKEALKKVFKIIIKVDDRESLKGVKTQVFKCYYGSSTFDTKQMGNLIDGLLDTMANYQVNTPKALELMEDYKNGNYEK